MISNIKSVEVFGSNCPTCKKLHELTETAVKELNLDTKVEYITDIQKLLDTGMMSSPVLSINGKPVLAGRLPSVDKIKELLRANNNIEPEIIKRKDSCCCGHC